MGRALRVTKGGLVYHVLNQADRRALLFSGPRDYAAFVRVLAEGQRLHPDRLLAYCVKPNHWHRVLWPAGDDDLTAYVSWVNLTHTLRWHADHGTVGSGDLYQGRFKSFPAEEDSHLLTLRRYVERNAVRAGLVARAAAWPWGSPGQRAGARRRRSRSERRPGTSPGRVGRLGEHPADGCRGRSAAALHPPGAALWHVRVGGASGEGVRAADDAAPARAPAKGPPLPGPNRGKPHA